jgi:hypothetical protein
VAYPKATIPVNWTPATDWQITTIAFELLLLILMIAVLVVMVGLGDGNGVGFGGGCGGGSMVV